MFRKQVLHLLIITVAFATIGLGCKGLSSSEKSAVKPVTLNYWSVYADSGGMKKMIQMYNARHPQIKINFRRLRPSEFRGELLDALAEDRGPDIVSMHHEWIKEYQSKLSPQPGSASVPLVIYKAAKADFTGAPQAAEVERIVFDNTKLFTSRQVKSDFVAGVAEDVLIKDATGIDRIYGLPLSMDTLQLYYNRDLLDKAGIPEPPRTWDDFNKGLKKLRKLDANTGKIVQAAAGLGRHDNIENAADIVMLLMMQNGAVVLDDSGNPQFDKMPPGLQDRAMPPGAEALAFYTDFANSSKNDVFTWDKSLPSSLDMFARGNLAYFFGYSYDRTELQARAPKLDYAVTAFPKLNPESVNLASYWVESVAKKSRHKAEAWHFINFITNSKNVGQYLNEAKLPTAMRSLVKKQLEDETLELIHPFVEGVLTAKGWYDGLDAPAARRVVLSMIRRIHENDFADTGANVYLVAVKDAVQQLRSTR